MRFQKKVTIIDYGLGNLFSIERALKYIGADVEITSNAEKVLSAERVIVPGVGAFGDGMKGLRAYGLIEPIKDFVKSGRPLLAICLGMQLLMSEGEEFGIFKGLDIIQGRVVPLRSLGEYDSSMKIPHIGWNKLLYIKTVKDVSFAKYSEKPNPWSDTILEHLQEGVFVYFIHSNIVIPADISYRLSETEYNYRFCSVVHKKNIYGCQFHPERSGRAGLEILRKFTFEI